MKKIKTNTDQPLIKSSNEFPVIGVGASAGGLDAFKKLIGAIPLRSGMAFVLVQHLHPGHESMLPELLQKVTTVPVLEISDEIKIEPDHIYVIPSNKILIANDGRLELSDRLVKRNELHLTIDHFLSSLAEVHQSHAIGVVLSGTGSDGTAGLKAIKDHGGITFAQDEESAAYADMPYNAIQAGVVDFILPPEKILQKITELTKITNGNGAEESIDPTEDDEIFRQILLLLRIRKGTDFTYYKQSTIRRRILRRMALNKNDRFAAYLKFLRENKAEQDILYQDLLIPVTSFFRDPKSFDQLSTKVFPNISENKINGPIRIWVAGCSTGEEVFSIAICIKEFLADRNEKVQIFASDISEPAIAKARLGIYSKGEVERLSPQRLKEFFTKNDGGWRVNKEIRDMCVFAVHNFLKDAPFGKMDLISCRNVLIYMEPYLQKKALATFHYSLNKKGFLILGKSETVSSVPDLFFADTKHNKIFSPKDVPGKFMQVASSRTEQSLRHTGENPPTEIIRADFQKTADDIMLNRYTPASVVVNEAMDIVHFRGSTANYLEQAQGKPTHNVFKMAKSGLAFELRNILFKAKREKAPVSKENIPVEVNGTLRNISIEAIPLPNLVDPHYLVLFHDNHAAGTKQSAASRKKTTSREAKNENKDLRIQLLEQELSQAREDMRSITEDQEASNEELQSANEELLSNSEELQSLNEELETGKEELQSTNEELAVVNQELVSMNEKATTARDYAENIISTIHEPLLVLDKNLRIKTANASFYKTFFTNESETVGMLIYDLGNRQWDIIPLRRLLENILPQQTMLTDYEVRQDFPNIGQRIMLLNAKEIKTRTTDERLILLAIEDVTDTIAKQKLEDAYNRISESEKQFRQIADFMPQIVWTARPDGYIDYYNKQWYEFAGFQEKGGDPSWIPILHPDDMKPCMDAYNHSIKTGALYHMECRFKDRMNPGHFIWFMGRAQPIKDDLGNIIRWFGTYTEIEDAKRVQDDLKQDQRRRDDFIKMASHELKTPISTIKGYLQLVLNMLKEEEKEKLNLSPLLVKSSLLTIDKQVNRLARMMAELLDLSRIESGYLELTKETFSLNQLVIETVQDLIYTNARHTINISHDAECDIFADRIRLGQVIRNFLTNAVKYSPDADKIDVRVYQPAKNLVAVAIKDYGIGIAREDHTKVFEQFYRVGGKSEQTYPGFGVGLFIASEIIRGHDGTVTVDSEKGRGSVFTFTLPLSS